MRGLSLLVALVVLVAVPAAWAATVTIDFGPYLETLNARGALYGWLMFDPETGDATWDSGLGIPDHIELDLLEAILADESALHHAEVIAAWNTNLASATYYLGATVIAMTKPPGKPYGADAVLAALATIGEWSIIDFLMDDLEGTATEWWSWDGAEHDAEYYMAQFDRSCGQYLGMCGDYDGDGLKNCYEYWGVGDHTGAFDPGTQTAASNWECWACLDEDNSSMLFKYDPLVEHVYVISQDKMTFDDAKLIDSIEYPGGESLPVALVTITNEIEDGYVYSLTYGERVWIGMTDEGSEGVWYWLSGEPFTYTHWRTGEPDGSGNAGQLYGDREGTWDDTESTNYKYAAFESTGAWPDEDEDGAPDAFEDNNGDLLPDGFAVPKPIAAFSAVPRSGDMPLIVQFTDESSGNGENITSWLWDFGDGETSTEEDPEHIYSADQSPSSSYTVSLTVETVNGSDTETKSGYITVNYLCEWSANISFEAAVVAGDPSAFGGSFAAAVGSTPYAQWDLDGDTLPDAASMALVSYVACKPTHGLSASVVADLEANTAAWETIFTSGALYDNSVFFAALAGVSAEMRTALGGYFGQDLSGLDLYGSAKAGERFSATGDLDNDGLDNVTEYDQVMAAGGDLETFVMAATDPNNFWPGNPDLPIAGIVGLGLLAGSILTGAAFALRKK